MRQLLIVLPVVIASFANCADCHAQLIRDYFRDYFKLVPRSYSPDDPDTMGKILRTEVGHYGLFYNCDHEEAKRFSPYITWNHQRTDCRSSQPVRDVIRQQLAEVRQRIRWGSCQSCAQHESGATCAECAQGVGSFPVESSIQHVPAEIVEPELPLEPVEATPPVIQEVPDDYNLLQSSPLAQLLSGLTVGQKSSDALFEQDSNDQSLSLLGNVSKITGPDKDALFQLARRESHQAPEIVSRVIPEPNSTVPPRSSIARQVKELRRGRTKQTDHVNQAAASTESKATVPLTNSAPPVDPASFAPLANVKVDQANQVLATSQNRIAKLAADIVGNTDVAGDVAELTLPKDPVAFTESLAQSLAAIDNSTVLRAESGAQSRSQQVMRNASRKLVDRMLADSKSNRPTGSTKSGQKQTSLAKLISGPQEKSVEDQRQSQGFLARMLASPKNGKKNERDSGSESTLGLPKLNPLR